MNIVDYAIKHSIRRGNTLAVVDAEDATRALTWHETISVTKRFAAGLQRQGVRPGDCVAILSRNDIYYAIVMLGTALAGATFIGLPPQSSDQELCRFLKMCCAKWLFVEPGLETVAQKAVSALIEDPPQIGLFDARQSGSGHSPSCLSFLSLLDGASEDMEVGEDLRDQPFTLVLTSGTTGWPKAAVFSHATMMARKPPPDPASPFHYSLHPTPLYHATGPSAILDALLGLHTLYISRQTDAYSIIGNIEKHSITKIVSHPRLAEEVSKVILSGERTRDSLRTLRHSILAGSMLTRQTITNLARVLHPDARIVNAYGCTESGLVFVPGTEKSVDPTCVGTVASGVDVRLINSETLEDVVPGIEGELLVRSRQVFAGYFDNPDATAAAFLEDPKGGGPYLRTGDRAVMSSDDGQYRITGRYKEVFKVADGKEVSPEEVQETLKSLASIEDAAVTSRPGRRGNGDVEPAAYVVVKGEQLSAQEIVDFVAISLSAYRAPTGGVVFVDDIPRTAFGKIVHRELVSRGHGEFIAPVVSVLWIRPDTYNTVDEASVPSDYCITHRIRSSGAGITL